MDFNEKVPKDKEVFALNSIDNRVYAEFLNTNGRIGWRLYDRFGRGILITEEEIRKLVALSVSALNSLDVEKNQNRGEPGCPEQ